MSLIATLWKTWQSPYVRWIRGSPATQLTHHDLTTATAADLQDLLVRRIVSSKEIVESCLAQIRERDGYLKAMLSISPSAVQDAQRLDQERSEGRIRGPLHGIPILIKVSLLPLNLSMYGV